MNGLFIMHLIQAATPSPAPSSEPLSTTLLQDLNIEFVGGLIGVLALAAGLFFTWREKRTSSIAGFRAYEKDLQTQMADDIKTLREHSEKYFMMRMELLSTPGLDADAILRKVDERYRKNNGLPPAG